MACAIEDDQPEAVENIVEEDCNLCSDAIDCYIELDQFKERLVEFMKSENSKESDKLDSSQIIQLQKDMTDIVQTQLKQQQDILKN